MKNKMSRATTPLSRKRDLRTLSQLSYGYDCVAQVASVNQALLTLRSDDLKPVLEDRWKLPNAKEKMTVLPVLEKCYFTMKIFEVCLNISFEIQGIFCGMYQFTVLPFTTFTT